MKTKRFILYIYYIGEVLETRIGVVDVKSALVHFHVDRTNGYESGGLIKVPFERQLFNLGNGFDWVNQRFEAPYNGTYFFSISGTKAYGQYGKTCIHVRLNNVNIAQVLSSENTIFGGFATTLSRKLNVGDKIELIMHEYGGNVALLYFTGWLVDQDLVV